MNRPDQFTSIAWLTINQAAERTQLSVATIRCAIRYGRLSAVKVNGGRIYRIKQDALDSYLTSFAVPTTQERT